MVIGVVVILVGVCGLLAGQGHDSQNGHLIMPIQNMYANFGQNKLFLPFL